MLRKTLTIAAAAVIVVVGASLAMLGVTTWSVHRAIAQLAERQAVRIGRVDLDALAGRIILRDVALGAGRWRIAAGSVSLPLESPGFDLVTSAVAQTATAGSASASDVTITAGPATYTIKKIDLSGTSLSNADLVALLDAKSAEPVSARLQKLNAASIVIPEMTMINAVPGVQMRATYSQILLANVTAGRIGTGSIAATTLSRTAGASTITGKAGAIQVSGLDLALLERILNEVRTDDQEPLKALADAITVSDLSITNVEKKTVVSVVTVAEKALKGRPLKKGFAALGKADEAGQGGDAPKTTRSADLLDDLGSSLAFGSYAMDRLTLVNSEEGNGGKLTVASIELADYQDRKLAALRVHDFLLAGAKVKIGFGGFDLGGITLPAKTRADAAPVLATDTVPTVAKSDIARIDVDASLPQADGTTSGLNFKVEHFGSSSDQVAGQFPSRGDFALDKLTFDVPHTVSPGAQELLAMGYQRMDISSAVATTYDEKLETLSVQKFLVSGVNMGSVTLAMDLANVSKGILSANSAVAKASAFAMLLKRIDLRLADNGLVDKALAWRAGVDGKTIAEERSGVIDLFAVTLPASLGNGASIKVIGNAVAEFIATPKTLHIAASSKDGLGASDIGLIGSPDELFARLDIQAEANK